MTSSNELGDFESGMAAAVAGLAVPVWGAGAGQQCHIMLAWRRPPPGARPWPRRLNLGTLRPR